MPWRSVSIRPSLYVSTLQSKGIAAVMAWQIGAAGRRYGPVWAVGRPRRNRGDDAFYAKIHGGSAVAGPRSSPDHAVAGAGGSGRYTQRVPVWTAAGAGTHAAAHADPQRRHIVYRPARAGRPCAALQRQGRTGGFGRPVFQHQW